ncbi:hypothetical protein D9M72_477350 [compost metagenome]
MPLACSDVRANGWKVVCFQARPPGSVMIGAITLTSCARLAEWTRSVLRSSVMRRSPTTTASATVYRSSRSTGATGQSLPAGDFDSSRLMCQTFHSSKEMFTCLVDFLTDFTWSICATMSLMNASIRCPDERCSCRSPKSSKYWCAEIRSTSS